MVGFWLLGRGGLSLSVYLSQATVRVLLQDQKKGHMKKQTLWFSSAKKVLKLYFVFTPSKKRLSMALLS